MVIANLFIDHEMYPAINARDIQLPKDQPFRGSIRELASSQTVGRLIFIHNVNTPAVKSGKLNHQRRILNGINRSMPLSAN